MKRHVISRPDEFSSIVENGHYILQNSIDFGNTQFQSIPEFNGIFDFSGFQLLNLRVPLFSTLQNAVIKSLTLKSVSFLAVDSFNCRFYHCNVQSNAKVCFSFSDKNSQFIMCKCNEMACESCEKTLFINSLIEKHAENNNYIVKNDPEQKFCQTCGYCGQCAHLLVEQMEGKLEIFKEELKEGEQHNAQETNVLVMVKEQNQLLEELREQMQEQKEEMGAKILALTKELEQEREDHEQNELADLVIALIKQRVDQLLHEKNATMLSSLIIQTANYGKLLNRSQAHQQAINQEKIEERLVEEADKHDILGFTPLQYAVLLNKEFIVQQLVGSHKGLESCQCGCTALILAVISGNTEFVRLLAPFEKAIAGSSGEMPEEVTEDKELIELLEK